MYRSLSVSYSSVVVRGLGVVLVASLIAGPSARGFAQPAVAALPPVVAAPPPAPGDPAASAGQPASPPAAPAPGVPAPEVVPALAGPSAPTSAATAKPKVLILRAESTAVPDANRIALTKEIFSQAQRYKQFDATLSGADLVEQMFEFECTEAGVDCLSRIGKKEGTQQVVYSEIVRTPAGTLQLGMRVIDIAQARVAQVTQQPLDNPDKPAAAVARGLTVLLGPVDLPPDQAVQPGTIHVVLFGGGVALVYVDDKLVGRTSVSGIKAVVPPGVHSVRVVRAGFREWSGRVQVPPGATVEQAVQLEQLAEALGPGGAVVDKPVETPLTHKWWFWTVLGAGVVGTAVAVAVLTSQSEKVATGTAAFSMDHNEAYLDPVFGGTGGQ